MRRGRPVCAIRRLNLSRLYCSPPYGWIVQPATYFVSSGTAEYMPVIQSPVLSSSCARSPTPVPVASSASAASLKRDAYCCASVV